MFRVLVASAIVVALLGAGERGSNSGLVAQSGRRLVVVADLLDRTTVDLVAMMRRR